MTCLRRHLARSGGGRRVREEPTIEWTCRFSFRHRTSEPITVVGSSDAVLCKTPLVRLDKSSFRSARYLRGRYNNAGMVARLSNSKWSNLPLSEEQKRRMHKFHRCSHSPTWSTRSHAAALTAPLFPPFSPFRVRLRGTRSLPSDANCSPHFIHLGIEFG